MGAARKPANEQFGAIAALFFGATAIGVAPIIVRLSEVGPAATALYRIILALPLLWLWIGLRSPQEFTLLRSKPRLLWLAIAGFFFAGDLAVWHWSLKFTTVANSTLFTNAAPIFVFLGAWLFLHEKLTRNLFIGLFVALAGGALLVAESLKLNPAHLLGDALAVLTAIFYAGYLLAVKHLRRDTPVTLIMAASGLVTAPFLLVVALAGRETLLPQTNYGWSLMIVLAILSHIGGQGLIAYALAHLPASFSSVTLLWQPVVAALLAVWFLGEKLTLARCLGGLIVLAGIAIANYRTQKPLVPGPPTLA